METQILREQNLIDQLAGLENRRGFYDTYGHNVGDGILVHIADTLQKNTESIGEVFRWGGEEFIILLSGLDIKQAIDVVDNIKVADDNLYRAKQEGRNRVIS